MHQHQHPAWNDLLAWLERHGMDVSSALHVEARSLPFGYGMVALREIGPSAPLFTIPAGALLNAITLAPHYPKAKPKLSSVQVISLHLFLHRPVNGKSSDPLFGPYIAVLPAEFDTHPLTWRRKQRQAVPPPGLWLLDKLPRFVQRDLGRVEKAFQSDWERVQSYLRSKPNVLDSATNSHAQGILDDPTLVEDDFLWAWLNVNTRCIFYRTKDAKSDPDNLTLCPILDFANHSSVVPTMTPQASKQDIWDMALKNKPADFTLLSPSEKSTSVGEELYLQYGFHSNQFLFVEYGFADSISGAAVLSGDQNADIDITPMVEDFVAARGDLGEWMKQRLLEEGYWGEWTLHSSPKPAHPSYRLITALRLYAALPSKVTNLNEIDDLEAQLSSWLEVVGGQRECISEENEVLWRKSLEQICKTVLEAATTHSKSLEVPPTEQSVAGAVSCVKSLWEEERYVAEAVMQSIEANETF
ncbi:hypothetical protein DFP72DRAFT_335316, partial [Ephemerocybe angulata]